MIIRDYILNDVRTNFWFNVWSEVDVKVWTEVLTQTITLQIISVPFHGRTL